MTDEEPITKIEDKSEKKWKKVERWLLIANLIVSVLQLLATSYQIFKS
ncbi:hypothetical protein [endosymbiont DhMRE of Dentiscutata heterogama]|nr:hypothetical protein [endosymbiont DhMRE of Dentiscutata heterogama]